MVTCQSSELGWEVTVELPADFSITRKGVCQLSLSMISSSETRKDGDVLSTVCINYEKLNVCHNLYKTKH